MREDHLKSSIERAQKTTDIVRNDLTAGLARRLSMVYGLVAFWRAHSGNLDEEFQNYAKSIHEAYNSGVRSLQLAPGGVVTYVYPLKGNESAIGFKILGPVDNHLAAIMPAARFQFAI